MGWAGKVAEREKAREMRAAGASVPAIAAELGVSRSSVSVWVRDVDVPAHAAASLRSAGARARARGLAASGGGALARRRAEEVAALAAEGRDRMGAELSDRDLLVAGAALYAGEGAKTPGKVSMANTDLRLISLFLAWLRRCFGPIDESRLRLRLYLHDDSTKPPLPASGPMSPASLASATSARTVHLQASRGGSATVTSTAARPSCTPARAPAGG